MAKRLRVVAAIVPLVAAGQLVAPTVASASTASSGGLAPLSSAEASALSGNVTQKVIVVLRDQVPQASAAAGTVATRRSVEAGEQHPLLGDLAATHAKSVRTYTALNAVAATVSPGEAARLAADPAVAEVVPDQVIHLASPYAASTAATTNPGRTPVPGSCPAPGAPPLLQPQALQTVSADSNDPTQPTARSLGIDGSGVKVGFIADGLDINNTDFIRPDGSHVFVDYKDFSGEGTAVPTGGGEAFLDASSVAAQGNNVYDVSHYSSIPLNAPCDIRVEGVSPGASLVGLDIFGAEDAGYNSSFLQAIDYAVSVDHVNVLNESLGTNNYPDDAASLDLVKQANDNAVAAGTTVTASSGDAGITSTIGSPSTDPNVISVGASTTYAGPAVAGYGGFEFPQVTGFVNDNISSLSSGGFTQDGSTVSLVAPGELNWALCSTDTKQYSECTDYAGNPSPVQLSGGTSESAPLTAGAAALVIQAYAKTHGGALPSPALVKQLLTSTADDISAPGDLEGAGRLDAYRAVVAAESYQAPAPAGTPDTNLEGTTQFNSVAPGGTAQTFAETVTNQGATPEAVSFSSRALGAYHSVRTATVTLSDTASPHATDYQGYSDNYETVNFTVPAGVSRLNGSIAFTSTSQALSGRVRMSLIDPTGRLADYSLPQGVGNYGDAQVANPTPGKWTAYIFSRGSAGGGFTGPVLFGASVANYKSFGTVTPSTLQLAPGATKAVVLKVTTPATPGDSAGSLIVSSAGQPDQAVPVTLRSLVPSGTTSFPGVLTGGNGRETVTGVTEYYQLDVAGGTPELNASINLANNPDNGTKAWLVDPAGKAQAYQSNTLVTSDSSGNLTYTNELGTNLHVLDPAAGRWTLIVLFAPTVSGTALSEPFTVSLDDNPASVTATGVPAGRKLTANNAGVARIKVTNTGTAPEAYFVDGRQDAQVAYPLPSLTSASTNVPLNFNQNLPLYLVPSQTSSLAATASTKGSEPIQFDLGFTSGDPDIASGQGQSVSASLSGSPVPTGIWDIAPDVVGPFGATGATPEAVTTSLTATTAAFDPAVSSFTGDLWQAAIGGPANASPVVVQPGQSASIPVTFAPSGTPGTVVSGVLYLDDDSLYSYGGSLSPDANTVAAIPYSYTVGK